MKGPEQPKGRFDLGEQTTLKLGRAPDNDIDHPQSSRHHALVEQANKIVKIVDVGSTNWTFVNGQFFRVNLLEDWGA